jgi:hypothetical protein
MKISIKTSISDPDQDLNPDSMASVDPDPGLRAAPQKEQAGLRLIKKLYLGVKVRTR